MIKHYQVCKERGIDRTPEHLRVRHSEGDAWCDTAEGIIRASFGPNSMELNKWIELRKKLGDYVGESIRRSDPICQPFDGYIDHLYKSVGLLQEFEASGTLAGKPPTLEDPLELKPNFFGLGVDLKRIIPWLKEKVKRNKS